MTENRKNNIQNLPRFLAKKDKTSCGLVTAELKCWSALEVHFICLSAYWGLDPNDDQHLDPADTIFVHF